MPLVSGVAIIIMVFMPLLALQGLEGRLFSPVALTIAFALIAALLLSLTVVPALVGLSVCAPARMQSRGWCASCMPAYDPLLARVMQRPAAVFVAVAIGIAGGGCRVPAHWHHLHAGDGRGHAGRHDPQAPHHLGRRGGADRHAHPARPESGNSGNPADHRARRRRRARHRSGRAQRDRHVHDAGPDARSGAAPTSAGSSASCAACSTAFPASAYAFTQPIDMRVQEMIIGARGDVVVQGVRRRHRDAQPDRARRRRAMRDVPGATDVFALRNAGMRYFTVDGRPRQGRPVRPQRRARFRRRCASGLTAGSLGIVLEGQVRTPLVIRGEERLRASPADLARVPVVAARRRHRRTRPRSPTSGSRTGRSR